MNKLKSLIESGLVDREDETILDTRTNLIWQQVSPDKTFMWQDSISYCKSLTLAGYTNWRLPTIEELKTLINERYTPAIDPIFECKPDWYWSSSTHVGCPSYAWIVAFSVGYVYDAHIKVYHYFVRAVCEV